MRKIVLATVALMATAAQPALADRITVRVTNLTSSTYFTPLIAVAHARNMDVFEVGKPASAGIRAIAEGGDTSVLEAAASAANASTGTANGLTAPGETKTIVFHASHRQRYVSIAGMLLPTNDGFVGVDSVYVPSRYTRRFDALGYDAGTESNNEQIANGSGAVGVPGIPADPGQNAGANGTGISGTAADGGPAESTVIHIHRGIMGDRDAFGGESDLDSAVHGWDGPVARVEIYRHRYAR